MSAKKEFTTNLLDTDGLQMRSWIDSSHWADDWATVWGYQ